MTKLLLAAAPIRQEYSPARSSAARLYLSGSAVANTSVSMTLSPPPCPPVPVQGSMTCGLPRSGMSRVLTASPSSPW